MKKRTTYLLIIILFFIFLIGATFLSLLYFEFTQAPSVKTNSFLIIKLQGTIVERAAPDLFSRIFELTPRLSMYDIWFTFRKAKADPRIEGIVLYLGQLQCDWGKINELRDLILDFNQSGKRTYAYFEETLDVDKEYYLATACQAIILHPLGTLGINGLGGYVPFFKNALTKLGIEFEVEHLEEYKTAYNMFTEDKFTPAHQEMLESIYKDIFQRYLTTVAQTRGKKVDEMKTLIDRGFFQGEEAVTAGLVDHLFYQDELGEFLKKQTGKKISFISYSNYLRVKPSSLGLNKGPRVALVYASGPIHTGESSFQTIGSTTLSRWFRKIRKDKSIKGVVFRVDSPGGSAVASDIIRREILLTKKEKPVVVSMSDVAGSGGYWISLASHRIIAQPQTLTGSIGVISGKVNMIALYKKIGVTAEKITYGRHADIFSTFHRLTPEERHLLKEQITKIYDEFLSRVAEARSKTKEEVHQMAKGRVWTGAQAQQLGLVDELGGLTLALQKVKELAGLPLEREVKLIVFPREISFWSYLFSRRRIAAAPSWLLQRLSSRISSQELQMLKICELLQQSGSPSWALMPFWQAPQ
jgi:protease-4